MGCVYLLECKETGDKYVGSTKKTIGERLNLHFKNCARYDNGKYISYCSSYEIIRRNNFSLTILENFDTEDSVELRKDETKWIQELNPMNKIKKAYISPEEKKELNKVRCKEYREKNKEACAERDRLYRENNKEACAERARLYREKNKETIAEKASEKVECECGVFICKKKLVRHQKTDRHKSLLEQQK